MNQCCSTVASDTQQFRRRYGQRYWWVTLLPFPAAQALINPAGNAWFGVDWPSPVSVGTGQIGSCAPAPLHSGCRLS
ncbi:hypothetical protein KCP69_13085 [Salmonella enterica subsp. enterica]|nr:hypothetical protein KCP69_13085 [Salmonella enterica subsp. enterica]